MSDGPDSMIGPYRLVRELGRGGMGVVHLAEDTRLGRQVAIKALPAELARDPARLERFEREAKLLAQLNHPNVAGIHGVEEQDGTRYLVLEYVEGESLADRLDRGALPVDEALEFAVQIAAGVAAAHDAGVVHRDLKPANVLVTPSGQAKVLDFGLARVEELTSPPGASDSATVAAPTHSPTMPGAILGTAAYMSPEQARGRPVDRRTDVWSFAVLLYEMLVGASPFVGETAGDSIGAVLHKDVDLSKLPAGVPAGARRVLKRCLQRDPDRRFRDIGDVRVELMLDDDEPTDAPRARRNPTTMILSAVVGGLLGLLVMEIFFGPPDGDVSPERAFSASITPPEGIVFHMESNAGWGTISPDGRWVVVPVRSTGGVSLWLRSTETGEGRFLPETAGGFYPFWSPDSQWVAFFSRGQLMKVEIAGGLPVPICESAWGRGGDWHENGKIVFNGIGGGPIQVVDAAGGTPREVTAVDDERGESAHYWPQWLEDGERFLYFIRSGRRDVQGIHAARVPVEGVDSSRERVVASTAAGVLTGRGDDTHLLWVESGALLARRFDPETATVQGSTSRIVDGVRVLDSQRASMASVADDGTLAWASTRYGGTQFVVLDRSGRVLDVLNDKGAYYQPLLSPDGERIAYVFVEEGQGDIWTLDLETGASRALTTTDAYDEAITWSPDGRAVSYRVGRGGEADSFVRKNLDGTGRVEELGWDRDQVTVGGVYGWLRGGEAIVTYRTAETEIDFGVLEWDGADDQPVRPLLTRRDNQVRPRVSADEEAILWENVVGSSVTLEVTTLERIDGELVLGSRHERVPIDDIGAALWSDDGTRIWCSTRSGSIYEIPVDRTRGVQLGTPELLFSNVNLRSASEFVVLDDGERFLVVADLEGEHQPIHVLRNWRARLESGGR